MVISSELSTSLLRHNVARRLKTSNASLEVVGCTERALVQMVCYVVPESTDPSQQALDRDIETLMRVKLEVLPDAVPAGAFIFVPRLFMESVRIEVVAIARRGTDE